MKNKIILICVMIGVLLFSFLIYNYENDIYKNRYHEHIENKTIFNDYDYSKINADTFSSKKIRINSFSSHLPVISIDTRKQKILGADDKGVSDYIKVSMSVYDKNTSLDKASFETNALVRYRGNSSRFFEKKGLRLKLIKDSGKDNDYSLLGLSEDHDFVLHGPYLDKTLLRNYLGYNITGEVMEYSPNVRYCEVFINKEYQGVYLLVENIKVAKDRVNISKLEKNSNVTSYLLEITHPYGYKNQTMFLNNFSLYTHRIKNTSEFNIKYPTTSKMTGELNDYITNDLGEFEKVLYSYDYDDNELGYSKYIDIDSFVNYVVLNEFFLNYDAGNNSTYIYKDKTGKYKLAFWDMNNIFDNYFVELLKYQDFIMKDKLWFQMFFKDEYFTNRVIERYRELRKTILSDEYLFEYIDDVVDYLGDAVERNFVKWGDSFLDEKNLLDKEERNIHSYDEAIKQLKSAINKRGKWLDKNIDTIRQFSHESKVKEYNP